MKRMSLQWRLTCIITLYIALICGCLTMLIYKNGVYYIDSLQETVDARGDDNGGSSDEIYISIPEDNWDDFANDFSVQVQGFHLLLAFIAIFLLVSRNLFFVSFLPSSNYRPITFITERT